MEEYFGHKPQDWERSMMRGTIDGTGRGEEMQRAQANPEQYTTARPNMSTEAAFSVGSMKGAGKGMSKGPETAYYKIEKPTSTAPAQQAPAPEAKPEPEKKPAGPIELSPEVQQAKERVNNYQDSIDGSQGSMFSTDEPKSTNEEAAVNFLDNKKSSLKEKMIFTPAN